MYEQQHKPLELKRRNRRLDLIDWAVAIVYLTLAALCTAVAVHYL